MTVNVNDYITFSRSLSRIESEFFDMAKLTGQKDEFIMQRHEIFVALWDDIMENEK